MKKYYECHITIEPPKQSNAMEARIYREATEHHIVFSVNAKSGRTGWTFSAIDGDPLLGPGTKFYATAHFNVRRPLEKVIDELHMMAVFLSVACSLPVVRKKVELVVYDEKTRI